MSQTALPNTTLCPKQNLSLEFISEHCTKLSVRAVCQICGPPGKNTEGTSPVVESHDLSHGDKDGTIYFPVYWPQYAVSCEYFSVPWFTANAEITEKAETRQAESFPIWSPNEVLLLFGL